VWSSLPFQSVDLVNALAMPPAARAGIHRHETRTATLDTACDAVRLQPANRVLVGVSGDVERSVSHRDEADGHASFSLEATAVVGHIALQLPQTRAPPVMPSGPQQLGQVS
jgi:hypothetical protein